jgi:hypothetical protein
MCPSRIVNTPERKSESSSFLLVAGPSTAVARRFLLLRSMSRRNILVDIRENSASLLVWPSRQSPRTHS